MVVQRIGSATCEIYKQSAAAPQPAVIVLHAGAWTKRHGTMAGVCKKLVENGFTVFNLAYSLAPAHRYPAALDDVKSTVRWVRDNAADLQVDPRKIFLWGYSAGGHLALLAGLEPSLGIRGIVAGAALSDLTVLNSSFLIENFLGKKYAEAPDLWAEASPLQHISPQSPPVFLYHGRHDLIVPCAQTQSLADKLTRQNVKVSTYFVSWLGHAGLYLLSKKSVRLGIDFLKTL